jgi:hypothetical protein
MMRVSLRMNPLKRLVGLIPRSQAQFEAELLYALKLAFWVALLAPIVIVPAYYLILAVIH